MLEMAFWAPEFLLLSRAWVFPGRFQADSEVQVMQRIFNFSLLRTITVVLLVLSGLGGCETNLKSLVGLGPADGGAVVEAGPASGHGTENTVSLTEQGFKASIDSSRLIFVVPVDGAGGPAPLVLADAVVASLRDTGQPAVLAEKINEMGPTIVGRISEVKQRRSIVWVTAVWELRAPYGTAVAEYRQQIVVDAELWKTGSAEAINLLVLDAGPRVSAMVQDFISPMAMPVGMRTIETDKAARELAALEFVEKEAAIRDPVIPRLRREPVSAPIVAPQPTPRPKPKIKSRFKGPASQQAVAVLVDKVSKESKKKTGLKEKTRQKPDRKVGHPRLLGKTPDKAKPKIKFKKKSVLMPGRALPPP